MNRVDRLFAEAKSKNRAAFLAFLTAGDPDLATTQAVAIAITEAAKKRGVPLLLEIGFPYSDPIADGPTIQTSYNRALKGGLRIPAIFETLATLRQRIDTPLVGMVSYSLVFRRGTEAFLDAAVKAGLDGLIIPDLPVEESEAILALASARGLSLIHLIAPTTPADRVGQIVDHSTGFVYIVSVTGITGERKSLPADLAERLTKFRARTKLPLCVGFGVSSPEQVAILRDQADGVIVGSAIVRRLENVSASRPDSVASLAQFVDSLLAPLA